MALLFSLFGPVVPARAAGSDLPVIGSGGAYNICRSTVNTDPWRSGIARSQPGRWWNPKRYGTGWDVIYSDDRKSLKVFAYTFNGNGHPVWLASDMAKIHESGDYWTTDLWEYVKLNSVISRRNVGKVFFQFFRDDPSRMAMRWYWEALSYPTGQPRYIDECLNDMTRLNPTYYTGVSSAPETIELFDAKSSTDIGVNQTFSGYWSDALPADPDSIPGVVMTIMQTSLPPEEGKFGEAAVRLTFNGQQDSDGYRHPIFVQAQRTQLLGTLPLTTDTFDLYLHYGGAGYTNGYAVNDCTPTAPTSATPTAPCVSNHRVGTYKREFRAASQYRTADTTFTLELSDPSGTVQNPVSGRSSVKLFSADLNAAGSPENLGNLVHRTTKLQDISVSRYVCTPPTPSSSGEETTCDIPVSWTGNGVGKPWKRDLGTLRYDATPLSNENIGKLNVALKIGDRLQFELWSGAPGSAGAQLLDRTPEVRAVSPDSANTGAISLPNTSPVSNDEDLAGGHDATVGAVAGSADVSGGAATYTVPIQVPPGRNGMQPSVSLSYSSRGGNGVAGLGWNLGAGSSISRCPQTLAQDGATRGVKLDAQDRLCLDGQRLMKAPGVTVYGAAGAEYRTEIESFAKITQSAVMLGQAGVCFTVKQKDGRTLTYGCAASSFCPSNTRPEVRPRDAAALNESAWLLNRAEDPFGNTMDYCYRTGGDSSEVLLDRILYTGSTKAGIPAQPTRSVVFDYSTRPDGGISNDHGSSWIAGGRVLQSQRLTGIRTFSPDSTQPARRYELDYKDTAISQLEHSLYSGRSLLRRIRECANEPPKPGFPNGIERCLPATEFTWSDGTKEFTSRKLTATMVNTSAIPPEPDNPTWIEGQEHSKAPQYRRRIVRPIGDLDGDGTRETLVSTNWYDGGDWHVESQLSKITADRVVKGAVTLGEFKPSADAVDIDGDGVSELLAEGKIYKWNRGRGAPVCDGGASTCSAPASSYFQQVATNLPVGDHDFVQSMADFNGDGAPDVLIRRNVGVACDAPSAKSARKAVEPPTGLARLCLFLNLQPGPILPGTTSFTFATPLLIDSVSSVSDDAVQHVADLDGNGIADIVIANRYGVLRILLGKLEGTALIHDVRAPTEMSMRSYTKNLRWMDINADGLDDMVIADVPGAGTNECDTNGNCFALWVLQINKGNGHFADPVYPARPAGMMGPGLSIDRAGSQWQLRYFGKMIQTDYDSDGRPDLLYPAHFAARMCFGAKATEGLCLDRPQKTCSQGICDANVCAAPPPEDGTLYLPHPNRGAKTCAADAYKSGLGDVDPSVYRYNVIRFVQTATGGYRLQVDETPIVAGASHLGNQRGRADDYFGDGMADIVADAGCPLLPTDNFPSNACELSAEGNYGPGSATSYLDSAHTIQLGQLVDPAAINLVINENLGDGARPGLAPTFPDLMTRAVNGLNDRAQWDYFPLSSSAGRTGTDFPLYTIDNGYVDTRHFLFQSTMPVVSVLARSNAASGGTSGLSASGARSLRYAYAGAMYNSVGRGFQGFRTISSETTGGSDRMIRTKTTFHQKFPLTSRVERVEVSVPAVAGTNGQISLETTSWQCNRSDRSQGCPGQDGNALPTETIYWPYVGSSTKEVFDLAKAESGSAPLRGSTSTTINGDPASLVSGWDPYGNLTYQRVTVQDGAGAVDNERYYLASHVTTTVNTFDTASSRITQWWLDKLTESLVQSSVNYHARTAPVGVSLTQKKVLKQFQWNEDRSVASSTVVDPMSGTSLVTSYGYPAPSVGQPTSVVVSGTDVTPSRETRTVYTADGYFPAAVTGVLSASSPSLNHTTTTSTRASDGQPASATDANGISTVYEYDAFGRLLVTATFGSNGVPLAPPTKSALRWCTSCSTSDEAFARYFQSNVADAAPSQRVWFDILGREVKSASRGFDGRWVNISTRYDNVGTVVQKSAPYFDGQTPLYTLLTYDRLGRPTTKRAPVAELDPTQGDVITRYTYDALETRIDVEPVNRAAACQAKPHLCLTMSRQHNALGQLMRTTDAQGGRTDYWFNPLGHAAALRDANGKATLARYNSFGHRVLSEDPNQGIWSFVYNALGELKSQTDARGVVTTVAQRDGLGRVLSQTRVPPTPVPAGLTNEALRDTWAYDSAGVKGQLAFLKRERTDVSETRPSWQESYEYDLATGRLKKRMTTIGKGPLSSLNNEYQYDKNYGYLKGVTYLNSPQPLTVWRRYTRYGALASLTDARLMTPLWSMTQADAYGKPTEEQFGYALSGQNTYARSTGQMLSQKWQPFDEPTFVGNIESLDYTYDVLGNLASQERKWRRYELNGGYTNVLIPTVDQGGERFDYLGRAREIYGYDSLQRLRSVDRQVCTGNASACPYAPVPEQYDVPQIVDYAYDPVGNILSKSDFAGSYLYGDAAQPSNVGGTSPTRPVGGACGPNALRKTQSIHVTTEYNCDRNGNQLTEASTGTFPGSRSLTYDGANLPTRVEHNDNWNAGVLGNRVNYAYGPDNARYLHTEDGQTAGTFGRTVYYGAEGYELDINQAGEEQHRIELGPVVYTRRRAGNTVEPSQVAYQLRDRLGSAISIADRWGHFNGTGTGQALPTAEGELRRFFDPYGAPRQVNFRKTDFQPELKYGKTTLRGFTGHEHLDEARLVHMNGRMFDYRTGRFLSVDPLVQVPMDSQSPNAYSYVMNNPLLGTDPTGYESDCVVTEGKSCTLTVTDSRSANKFGERITYAMDSDGNVRSYSSNGGAAAIDFEGVSGSNGSDSGQVPECVNPSSPRGAADQLKGLAQPVAPLNGRAGRELDGAVLTFADTVSQGVATSFGEHFLGLDPAQMDADKKAFEEELGPFRFVTNLNFKKGMKKSANVLESSALRFWRKSEFKGIRVYKRNDIFDIGTKDGRGRSNLERMRAGLAPLGTDGKPLNLHHMTQSNDSPLAEVTETFHRANSRVIHINPSSIPSGIDRKSFDAYRRDYWKSRADDFEQ